ncbi:MAG: hypothetical protein ABEI99_02345, partial [Halobaculum sp.]
MSRNPIDLARDRKQILDLLRDGPLSKRDVLDRVTLSRSTVDRAIDELLSTELIETTDGGYETTPAGVIALRSA